MGDSSLHSSSHVRLGSRLCENSEVKLSQRTFVSNTLNKKRTALAGVAERREERTQFCSLSARARFHIAWVKLRRPGVQLAGRLYPQLRTWPRTPQTDALCQ